MGLDQYAYVRKYKGKNHTDTQIAQWRKHNRLQGWMENTWRDMNGYCDDFNCEDFYLTIEDLDELEKAINNKELPETEGFFFGTDSYEQYEEYFKEQDLEFIKKARKALNKGHDVYYTSWW